MSDKNGAVVEIQTDAATTFLFDKNPASFGQTVGLGVTVKADVLPDGTVVQVTSKTAKNSNSNTPNTPTPLKASSLDQLQLVLGASDEEWKILHPLIVDIQSLQSQIGAAIVALKSVQPPTLSLEETKTELAARRDAHAKLADQLAKDRAELTNLITLRQELILVQLGIIE